MIIDSSDITALWKRLRPLVLLLAVTLILLSASRALLMFWQADRLSIGSWQQIFRSGLRIDLATFGLLFTLPLAMAALTPGWRWMRLILVAWFTAVVALLAFMEVATPPFMSEYGLRPNRLFLEYLIYPKEVFATLVRGHLPSTLAGVATVIAVVVLVGRWLSRSVRADGSESTGWPVRSVVAVVILLAGAMAARSTLGHRPINPAMVAFSSDPTVNQLPLNSTYSLLYAAKDWLTAEDGAEIYGSMPWPEVIAEVRRQTGLPMSAFNDPGIPTGARRPPIHQGKPRNLVIVLEESLGAQFVGHLGGLPLTPHLDALAAKGWDFRHLYATGTRSVRGIEAVVTGFTPTPAQAVVKLPRSQRDFFSLATVLSRNGYDTAFYYGGESHFDNMRSFFLGNGFKRIIEQGDYRAPAFVGSWGVSDEDLMRRAHDEFLAQHAAGKPFFGLVFSSSNHDPFEFPDGRIRLHEQPKQTRNNAAEYADYAIGEFFRLAMESPYWNDTVFLIVADHDSRVVGRSLVPIANFRIPGVILGGGIVPRRDERIVSQIDLPPTLLSLVGIGDETPMIGRDLTDPDVLVPGRAMMQYDRNFAWMEGNTVAILSPNGIGSGTFTWNPAHHSLTPARIDPALQRRALAVALWGSETYRRGLYHAPEMHSTSRKP